MVCKHQSELPEFSSSQIQQSLDRTEKVFNATYTFWYFEPFAWVTQMMNVFKWDFKTEEDGWPVDLFYMKKILGKIYRKWCWKKRSNTKNSKYKLSGN